MIIPTALALAAATAAQPNVAFVEIAPAHYRITTTLRVNASPSAHADAQMRLMKAAERLCRGKGTPTSDGALELNRSKQHPGRLELTENYRCVRR
jgi:hypothetical protein